MRIFAGALLGLALVISAQVGVAADKPEPSQPLSTDEVTALFSNKTWKWEDGSGFFARRGEFRAVRKLRETARGAWTTPSPGEICISGSWATVYTRTPFDLCWQMVRDARGQIWMSSAENPDEWNTFDPKTDLARGDVDRWAFAYARSNRHFVLAEYLEPPAVRAIFGEKSWLWEDGIAYFGQFGRFKAKGVDGATAEGRWYADNKGQLCFEGVWSSIRQASSVKECWLHASDSRGRLWQTPADDPEGWYLFDTRTSLWADDLTRLDAMGIRSLLSQ